MLLSYWFCSYLSNSVANLRWWHNIRDDHDRCQFCSWRGSRRQTIAIQREVSLINGVDCSCLILPVRLGFLWMYTVRNDKSWFRKMRYGPSVSRTRTGFDRVGRMLFDVFGDRNLSKYVKRRVVTGFCWGVSLCSTEKFVWLRYCCFLGPYSRQREQWKKWKVDVVVSRKTKTRLKVKGIWYSIMSPIIACGGGVVS